MDDNEGFNPGKTLDGVSGFNMAFGFKSGKPLDPRIGKWAIQYIKKNQETSVKEPISLQKCIDVCDNFKK